MNKDTRREIGQVGERIAAEHLARYGLEIVERNYRTRSGEIDLIAKDDSTVIFCEVKTRCQYTPGYDPVPLVSITPAKQLQVRRMAREWLAEHREKRSYAKEIRFDAVGVTVDSKGALVALEHLEGAF